MAELTSIQRKVLNLFKKSSLKDKFYWTGGTLLSSLYLHHRQSKDLDFFSNSPFSYQEIISFIKQIKEDLSLKKIEQKKIFDRWEFFLHNKSKIRIEFVLYDYPKLKSRKKWQGILVDSLDDIATNKVMAFFDRNDPKDLFDLYFLLTKKKYKVRKLLKMVEKKFGVEFSESSFWSESHKALKDLDNLRPLLMTKSSKERDKIIKKVKNYFIDNSVHYLDKFIG